MKPRARLMLCLALGLVVTSLLLASRAGGEVLAQQIARAGAGAPAPRDPAQAIVVLTGGGPRLREAARVHRQTGLPVLASGGDGEAARMKAELASQYQVAVRWTEDASLNTEDNARLCASILKPQGIHRIILVTHALHMWRARTLFQAHGLAVIPSPSDLPPAGRLAWSDFVPTAQGWKLTREAIHEFGGLLWFWVRSAWN